MIDIKKQYRTRDGREVRIYATDGQDEWPIHGAVLTEHGWSSDCWKKNGSALTDAPYDDDLIEVRPRHKRVVWVNVYPSGHGCHYDNVTDANCNAGIGRIACLRVELDFEEGEGL